MPSAFRLEDYDVSPITGFLPEQEPARRLADSYYTPWLVLNEDLQALQLTGTLRARVEELPVLTIDRLIDERERRWAYTILGFLAHTYVWCDRRHVKTSLPAGIAVPWVQLACTLELQPVVSCASVVLWNWRKLDPQGPLDLTNVTSLQTFTGSTDETWFYLITAAVEAHAIPILRAIPAMLTAIDTQDTRAVLAFLHEMRGVLADLPALLNRMYEHCDPHMFYTKIHAFLTGWSNQAATGLPHGLLYKGVDDVGIDPNDHATLIARHRTHAGGSAAQSSIIQVLDIVLGIQHYPTGQPRDQRSIASQNDPDLRRGNYLVAMRAYMPGPHRRFLEDLGRQCHLRAFVQDQGAPEILATLRRTDPDEACLREDMLTTYNDCVGHVRRFRDAHIQMVTRYVVSPARKSGTATVANATAHPTPYSHGERPRQHMTTAPLASHDPAWTPKATPPVDSIPSTPTEKSAQVSPHLPPTAGDEFFLSVRTRTIPTSQTSIPSSSDSTAAPSESEDWPVSPPLDSPVSRFSLSGLRRAATTWISAKASPTFETDSFTLPARNAPSSSTTTINAIAASTFMGSTTPQSENRPSSRRVSEGGETAVSDPSSPVNSLLVAVDQPRQQPVVKSPAVAVMPRTGRQELLGSGGTSAIKFLKQVRDETTEGLLH
ncbi:tryptophan 2,3- dioxygenase [Tieghemiomyces parasiticus]|uniref:Tryptophan 2,3- dioxygenase n=1 Tax=Tieghemiomyces parasiticus TaxID=78921 RepID=A0A9W7ZWR4_9FUNG|nr:tryptophan 2,3- dioxygenase [Tieghemiomyces parasiticus]